MMSLRPLLAGLALLGLASPALATTPLADPQLARNLAATCTSCHGSNGHSLGGIESLAGRPADQLLGQLLAFRRGELDASIMDQISRGYDEDQLKLISNWFAAQD